MGICSKIGTFVLTLLQIAGGIAIVVIVATELHNIDVNNDGDIVNESCLLDNDTSDENLCRTAYAGVALTFAATIAFALLQCCTCNFCGAGGLFEFILSGILCAGWVVYSVFLVNAYQDVQDLDPQPFWNTDEIENFRLTIVVLSIAQAAIFALLAILGLGTFCFNRGSKDY